MIILTRTRGYMSLSLSLSLSNINIDSPKFKVLNLNKSDKKILFREIVIENIPKCSYCVCALQLCATNVCNYF